MIMNYLLIPDRGLILGHYLRKYKNEKSSSNDRRKSAELMAYLLLDFLDLTFAMSQNNDEIRPYGVDCKIKTKYIYH